MRENPPLMSVGSGTHKVGIEKRLKNASKIKIIASEFVDLKLNPYLCH